MLMELNKKLMHLFTEKGLRRGEVAKIADISRSALTGYMHPKNPLGPGKKALRGLSRALGVTIDYLLDDSRDYPPRPQDRLNSKVMPPPSPPLEQRIEIIRETDEEFIVRIKKRC